MKIFARTALVAVSIAALGCVSTAAYAAIAPAVLPVGDTIYQSNYSSDPTALWTTAADGTATLIGTPASSVFDSTDGAWNPVTGASYVVGNGYEGPCELWSVDVTTGQFTFVADITGDDGDTYNCDAFDIAPDGTAWISMYDEGSTATIAKLNLADGTTSSPVAVTGLTNGLSWLAVQPSTGTVFLGDWGNGLLSLDLTTGVATSISAADSVSVYDAAFDSAGHLWLTTWPETTFLYSADVADYAGTFVQQGAILLEGTGDNTGTDSLWIARGPVEAPKAVLAETGIDATLPLAAGFGMLLLGAGTLVIRRHRRA